MAVTREQFESGMTYDAYKAQMTRNREQLEQNEKDVQLGPEDVQAFRDLPRPVNVMVLAEDWCGDVIANVPVVGRLAQESNGKLNVRIHLRDQEPGTQIMDQYLNKGQFKSMERSTSTEHRGAKRPRLPVLGAMRAALRAGPAMGREKPSSRIFFLFRLSAVPIWQSKATW